MVRPGDKEYVITRVGDGKVQTFDVFDLNNVLIERYERTEGGWLFYGATSAISVTGSLFKSFAPGQIILAANGSLFCRALSNYIFNVAIKVDATLLTGDPLTVDLYDNPADASVGDSFTRPASSILAAPIVPIGDTYVNAPLKSSTAMPYEKNRALCIKLILSGAGNLGIGDIHLRFS
jgi:hypothetical protein